MGNTTTKFRKALINGDENLACQIYENNPQLKESLDPNTSYGEPYQHNTPLHYAARHGMNRILGTFLFGRDGNPNKRNVHNETSMHLLCMGPQIMISEGALHPRLARPAEDDFRRADCLQMILRWKGAKLDQGEYERAAIDAVDNKKNTPLHYAAASGMKTCVELLVKHGGDLFAENENKDTPCDCAEKQHHKDLALNLESQMVFSRDPEAEEIEAEYAALDKREPYEGLRPQDLRRLKDMLIVETADMLQAPLFTAEALLRAHVVGVSEAYEDAANCLWLLTNSKPCANCKSPIQKNEGCNHMQCAKTDLEMVTEDLAQKVNRPYLRTPRHKIIKAACLVQQKRQEFLASVARGVAPADSPEAPRRRNMLNFSIGGGTDNSAVEETCTVCSVIRQTLMSQALSSLDEDDPNILLAIQLSLQESGLAIDENRDFLSSEASLGAIGTSLPSRLDSDPRSTDSPRAALSSSELLELGDGLMRLGAESDPFSTDTLSSHPLSEARSEFCPSSSDPDSAGQEANINDNLLGNIMAWFHDMNPQSIALIPPAAPEISADSQLPCVKDGSEGVRDVELMQPEDSVFEDAVVSEGRGTQIEEENPLGENILAGEAVSQAGDGSNEIANEGHGSSVSSQTPQTSSDWLEQVHLV
ncbi:hypothetical protein CB1_000326002 [Camelus ferus]|nr:hypothetical protein CB1_000326002 [Camelus ferus]